MLIFDDEKFYKKFIGCHIPSNYQLDYLGSMRKCFNRLYANSIISEKDINIIDSTMGMYKYLANKDVKYVFARQDIKEEEKRKLLKMEEKTVNFSIEEIFYIWSLDSEKDRAISLAIMFLSKYFNRKTIFCNFTELKLLVGMKRRRFKIEDCKLANGCYYFNKKGYRRFYGYENNVNPKWYQKDKINQLYKKILPIEYKYNGECYLVKEMRNDQNFIENLHLSMEQLREENKNIFSNYT